MDEVQKNSQRNVVGTYICSLCGGTFGLIRDENWSEEEAKKEYHKMFPNSKWEDRTVVCDDCWNRFGPKEPWIERYH